MDLRLLTVTCLAAFLGTAGSNLVIGAEVTPPPSPRPWNGTGQVQQGSTSSSSSNAPMTEANGSRLRVTDKAIEETQTQSQPQPKFASEAPLRDESGYYMGASIGMNFAQGDEIDAAGSSNSGELSPVGGFKLGYVYPFDSEPIDQFYDETGGIGLRLAGSLEVEAFYLRSESDFTAANRTRDLNIDSGYFMLNAFLKARVSQFTFYAGPGVGLAWTHASGGALTGDQDDAYLAYQMSGGIEYLVAKDWSIFTEYKWLVTDDFQIDTVAGGGTNFGMFEQNLLSFGVKRHF